ncbi:unnamed protein product [Closterium sp. Yama58-4]|nr:unnamed protein product [Closterium sp. Yama58-4]
MVKLKRMISDDGKGVGEVLDEKVCDSHDNCTPLAVVGFIRFALHPSTPNDTDCYGGDPGPAEESGSSAAAGASSSEALNCEDSADTGSVEWVSGDSDVDSDSASVRDSGEVADASASDGALNSEDKERASGDSGAAAAAAGVAEAKDSKSQQLTGRRKLGGKERRDAMLGGKGKHERGREGKERDEVTVEGMGEGGVKGSVKGEAARWRKEHAERLLSPLQLAFAREATEALKAAQGMRWTYSLSHMPQAEESNQEDQGNTPAPYHLPPNVAIVSLQELAPNEVTVRFAHLYEAKEHPQLSSLASVHLPSLFASRKIKNVTELNLFASQKRSEMRPPLEWQVEEREASGGHGETKEGRAGESTRLTRFPSAASSTRLLPSPSLRIPSPSSSFEAPQKSPSIRIPSPSSSFEAPQKSPSLRIPSPSSSFEAPQKSPSIRIASPSSSSPLQLPIAVSRRPRFPCPPPLPVALASPPNAFPSHSLSLPVFLVSPARCPNFPCPSPYFPVRRPNSPVRRPNSPVRRPNSPVRRPNSPVRRRNIH